MLRGIRPGWVLEKRGEVAPPSICLLCSVPSQNLTYEIILTLGQAFEVAYQLALQAQKSRPMGASAAEMIETKSSKPVPKPRVGMRKSAVCGPCRQDSPCPGPRMQGLGVEWGLREGPSHLRQRQLAFQETALFIRLLFQGPHLEGSGPSHVSREVDSCPPGRAAQSLAGVQQGLAIPGLQRAQPAGEPL